VDRVPALRTYGFFSTREVPGLHVEDEPDLRALRALEVQLVLEDGARFLDEELEIRR
jgi:hypothetical protein